MEAETKVRKRLSTRYFEDEALRYDSSRLADLREMDVFFKEIEIIKDFLKKARDGKILDVGCGTGRVFPYYSGREIHGTDISKDMLKIAQKRVPAAKLKVGDATSLPYKDNSFPVVITSRYIMHTPDFDKAIAEMARVSEPGGSIIIDFPNRLSLSFITTKLKLKLGIGRLKYFNLFKYSQVKEIARRHGLKVADVRSKAFFPPKVLPERMHRVTRALNSLFAEMFPLFSTPMYVRFIKL